MTTKEIILALRKHYAAAYDSLTVTPDDYQVLGFDLNVECGVCMCMLMTLRIRSVSEQSWVRPYIDGNGMWGPRPSWADTHAEYLKRVKLRLDILNGIDIENIE